MKKNIMLTGASGAIGSSACLMLAARGHAVAGTIRSRSNPDEAAVATQLEAAGVVVVEMDVTVDESVETAVEDAMGQLRRIDVLVNNAGLGSYGIQELMTPDQMQRVFDVNVFGLQRVMRAVLPGMRANADGAVLFTSSLLGRFVTPFYGTYAASKWAIEALAECYRAELARSGIRVGLIEPGALRTAFFDAMIRPADPGREATYGEFAAQPAASMERLLSRIADAPGQKPEAVAEVITRLAETTSGALPFRTIVDFTGVGDRVQAFNEVADRLVDDLFTGFGTRDYLAHNK